MKLTEEERNKVLSDLNRKCQPITCPMCKSISGFDFGDEVYHLITYDIKENTADTSNFGRVDTVAVVCKNCGYIAQFKK